MSEELRDASRILPQSMIWSTVLNGAMGWVMVITFCFCIGGSGNSIGDIIATPTGYPFIEVFYNATGQSTKGATAMVVFIIIMVIFCDITLVATASRQLFAFARDRGVPLSPWLSSITPGWKVPLNSIVVTLVTTSLLSLLNIASPTALNSITSLTTNAILSSYICSIGCIIWRRLTNSPLLPTKFSLGKWGLLINIVSEVFLVAFFILCFFPPTPSPDPVSMNWNVLIYGTVVVFSIVYFFVKGRYQYVGPVEYVRKLE